MNVFMHFAIALTEILASKSNITLNVNAVCESM